MRSISTHVVPQSVGLLYTTVSCAKTAEPIDMPFGVWTRGGTMYETGGHIPPRGGTRRKNSETPLGNGRVQSSRSPDAAINNIHMSPERRAAAMRASATIIVAAYH